MYVDMVLDVFISEFIFKYSQKFIMFATIFSLCAMNVGAFIDFLNLVKWLNPDFDVGCTALFLALCWYIDFVPVFIFCPSGEIVSAGMLLDGLDVPMGTVFCFFFLFVLCPALGFVDGFLNILFLDGGSLNVEVMYLAFGFFCLIFCFFDTLEWASGRKDMLFVFLNNLLLFTFCFLIFCFSFSTNKFGVPTTFGSRLLPLRVPGGKMLGLC